MSLFGKFTAALVMLGAMVFGYQSYSASSPLAAESCCSGCNCEACDCDGACGDDCDCEACDCDGSCPVEKAV